MMAKVTIIIPTYRDWDRLLLCLDSISELDYCSSEISVLVVNNDVESKCPFHLRDNVELINESKPGSYSARNAALQHVASDCEIIAFTDSDCIVDKYWIRNAVEIFNNDKNLSRIAGRIDIFPQHSNINKFLLIYEKAFAFDQRYYASHQNMAATANLIVRADIFSKIGFFDDSLLSGGDSEWGQRASKNGFNIKYSDDVLINHPSRGSFSEIIVKTRREAAGHLKKNGAREIANVVFGFLPPVKSMCRLFNNSQLGISYKFLAFFIRYYLRVVATVEKICVGLFGKPEERR